MGHFNASLWPPCHREQGDQEAAGLGFVMSHEALARSGFSWNTILTLHWEPQGTCVSMLTADRYCDTRSRVLLLDTKESRDDLAWCGATCSRTVGASLATAGYQAHGKPMKP
jgi:hypothetical protein